MKTLIFSIAFIAANFSGTLDARAFDAGPSLGLERYTIQADGSLLYETGNLLANGHFRVLSSEILDATEIDPYADYQAISGRPICVEEAYNTYEASRIIPHWVRSRYDFPISFLTYVIVAIVGQDPNPTITIQTQPKSIAVLQGSSTFLFVDAEPFFDLTYQWTFGGKALHGQTESTLFLTNITTAQAGNYAVLLNTGGKNVQSKIANVRVVLPVSITTPPKSQSVKAGQGVVFRVAAKGTLPFTYQWYFNEAPIPKATASFYSIAKVKATDAGRYGVVVGNGLSSGASPEAVLTVLP